MRERAGRGTRVHRVVVFGQSLTASAIAASLRGRPGLELLQLDDADPEALARLRDAHPDAIILCELAKMPPALVLRLLEEHPDRPVVGFDGDRTVVLSSRQASLRTADDLLAALGRRWPLPEACQRRPEGQGG